MPTGTDKSALLPARHSRLRGNDGFLLFEGMAGLDYHSCGNGGVQGRGRAVLSKGIMDGFEKAEKAV
jgi:hypothetical protein